jgi:hypothetical protein
MAAGPPSANYNPPSEGAIVDFLTPVVNAAAERR